MRQDYRSMDGFGAGAMAGILVGVLVLWFIFTSILDYVGNRHKAKVHDRMQRWSERAQPNKSDSTPREAQGYTLSY